MFKSNNLKYPSSLLYLKNASFNWTYYHPLSFICNQEVWLLLSNVCMANSRQITPRLRQKNWNAQCFNKAWTICFFVQERTRIATSRCGVRSPFQWLPGDWEFWEFAGSIIFGSVSFVVGYFPGGGFQHNCSCLMNLGVDMLGISQFFGVNISGKIKMF